MRLNRIQNGAGNQHRFHLIVGSELGQVQTLSSEIFDHIATRVLFSPTISPYEDDEEDQLSLLIRVINGISSRMVRGNTPPPRSRPVRRIMTGSRNNTPAGYEGRIPPPRRLFESSDEEDGGGEGLRNRPEDSPEDRGPILSGGTTRHLEPSGHAEEELKVPLRASWLTNMRQTLSLPSWYPFLGSEYKNPPQNSTEVLYVEKGYFEQFQSLASREVAWIYRECFRFVYNEAKKRNVRGMWWSLKYSEFTPPWIRCRIVKGDENDLRTQTPLFLFKVAVTDIRDQRSIWGVKRLAYLLGAFYQEEEAMAGEALDHLLYTVETLRCDQPNKRRVPPVGTEENPPTRRRVSTVAARGVATVDYSIFERTGDSRARASLICSQDRTAGISLGRGPVYNTPSPRKEGHNRMLNDTPSQRNRGSQGTPAGRGALHMGRGSPRSSQTVSDDSGGEIERNNGTGRAGGTSGRSIHRSARRITTPLVHVESEDERQLDRGDPTGSGSDLEHDGFSMVRCAAGSKCVLRESVIYPTEPGLENTGITGKCNECRKPLHDLCGGGEDGPMLCPPCKFMVVRREIISSSRRTFRVELVSRGNNLD